MRKKLQISQGSLSEDNGKWDIEFWQNITFFERAKIASEMAIFANKIKNKKVKQIIDKTVIKSGSYKG